MGTAGTIIVVGRTNTVRQSDAIRALLLRLEACGFTLVWFQSHYTLSYARVTARIERKFPALSCLRDRRRFS
ncbi:hypothetical protein [Novosphingobium sp. Leaf2]|uniref:hypothetical protein n=1 Tax=Novosphingobium sp. Leaf2 TaxID=1735670 RepID=UPI000AF77AF7|nr:hypothetical protein [Novosphingobium sp. Leaf2]